MKKKIRTWVKNLLETAVSLLRVAVKSRYPAKLASGDPVCAVCFVLGNGPSLKTDLGEGLDILRNGDVFCVNGLAESDLYQQIQPKYYTFADPMYWLSDAPEKSIAMRKHLFDTILSKTTWPLTIYVPFEAKKMFESVFCRAPNIRLVCYNSVPVRGVKCVVNMLYDSGLGGPQVQNVLIAGLFISLRIGYKKIVLLGADHSWHETLVLDDANRVCWRDRNFSDSNGKLVPFSMDGDENNLFTMDVIFYSLAKMFDGYWKIEEYSKRIGAQIYNASSVTFIDAFKRRRLSDMRDELSEGVGATQKHH